MENAAKNIKIPNRSFEEMIQHFIEKYHAFPCQLTDFGYKRLKASVIFARFPQLLSELDSDVHKAMNYPDDQLDLRLAVYAIPDSPVLLEVEFNTEYMQCSNAGPDCKLLDELRVWRGIAPEDVQNFSQTYVDYVNVLCEYGLICRADGSVIEGSDIGSILGC